MTTTAKTTTTTATITPTTKLSVTATAHQLQVQRDYRLHRITTKNAERLSYLRREYAETNAPLDSLQWSALNALNTTTPFAIAYAIWYVFGLGQKPTPDHYEALESFRHSENAQTWHTFCYGTEYTPMPVDQGYDLRTERAKATTSHNATPDIVSSNDASQSGIATSLVQ